MTTVAEIEDAIRALSPKEREHLADDLPSILPELNGDAKWERIADDAAGNFWATLPGIRPDALLIGGHIDSVPNGGWLDGCLNVLAGVEVLRRIDAEVKGVTLLRKSTDDPALFSQVEAQYQSHRLAYQDAVDTERAALAKAQHDLKSALEVESKFKQTLPILQEQYCFMPRRNGRNLSTFSKKVFTSMRL